MKLDKVRKELDELFEDSAEETFPDLFAAIKEAEEIQSRVVGTLVKETTRLTKELAKEGSKPRVIKRQINFSGETGRGSDIEVSGDYVGGDKITGNKYVDNIPRYCASCGKGLTA